VAQPLVSIITIFLNEQRFLADAVASVRAQTVDSWELLLVDDGSTDGSSDIARSLAASSDGRIRYLEHPAHENRGMSASRNLGISAARGDYVAFLDADDIWVPEKLAEQLAIMQAHPAAAFVCGSALWWYGWTGSPDDAARDFVQRYHLAVDVVTPPSGLLLSFLNDEWSSPCDLLVRRSLVERVGGYEASFRGMYEDQAFHAKLSLASPCYVSSRCWYWYRQHPQACTTRAHETGAAGAARQMYLEWLEGYVAGTPGAPAEVRRTVRRLLFPYRHPRLVALRNRVAHRFNRVTQALR
jgi:glycosyltransferase involved in cell wall biosynthesis